ncbi:DUF1345 domain-containing protein [Falsiroseomonas sp. HW251]|uniref:DUF1345 domain-containing protein n=1 Tax=Falsiroseomonas sp. HW251 TaxID=3390998 RepID=UPI003D30F8E3
MLRHRPRLAASAALGLCAALGAGLAGLALPLAILLGWCCAAAAWLALILPLMLRIGPQSLRARTAALDEGAWVILAATVSAALFSLMSVIWALADAPSPVPPYVVALGLGTVLLSWLFVHVLFAVHYAHEHCRSGEGIAFPGNEDPDFAEFLYFAFTIGMTFQVSDATTTTPRVRRLVVVHGLVSFLFNAVILGAAVNLAAALAR